MGFLRKDMYGSAAVERERFKAKCQEMTAAGQPIWLQLGFGRHPLKGFINLDFRYRVLEDVESDAFYDTSFIFDWPAGLPLENDTVDFVFHEDMYEHLTQKEQYMMLAETFRVLKPGHFHRINAPNLEFIMKTQSDFTKGLSGIYDEWAAWHHDNVPTPDSLRDQAKIVGYKTVHFNGKGQTVSGVPFRERRPGGNFPVEHNLHADLEK